MCVARSEFSQQDPGAALFGQFVAQCAFIHDDVSEDMVDEEGNLDWDQYATNPFLLGAQVCAVDTLAGFGDEYIDYLASLAAVPREIVIPSHRHPSLVANLLSEDRCISRLQKEIQSRKLHVSSFYSDSAMGFDALLQKVSSSTHTPRLYPSASVFEQANDKVAIRTILEEHGIALPEGMTCWSESDLRYFFKVRRKYPGVLAKKIHWATRPIVNEQDIDEVVRDLKFPIVVETCYEDVVATPVSHYIRWHSKCEHLFTLEQVIVHWQHYGNKSAGLFTVESQETIADKSFEILSVLSDYEGVLGFDFIITKEGEVLPVDVNPRFNSSTYPCYFLQRLGYKLERSFFVMRVVDEEIASLSSLLLDPDFVRLTPDSPGMFLYNPVWDFERCLVHKFTYLCLGDTAEELDRYESALRDVISTHEFSV